MLYPGGADPVPAAELEATLVPTIAIPVALIGTFALVLASGSR